MKQLLRCGQVISSGSLLGLLLGCAALSSGCEKKAELAPSGKSDSAKIPADWPTDVAIYPGSKVRMNKSNPSQQLLFLETPDAEQTVVEFYKSKLAPLRPRLTTNDKQQSVLSYQGSTGRRVMLSIGKQAGGGPKTLIAVIVNRPQEPISSSQ